MKRITVLLAEDHTIVREGFCRLLELDPDLEVIGEAQDGRQAIAVAKSLRPDVILMDIAMPLLNGLEATRQMTKAAPGTKVLILSAHCDEAYISRAKEVGAVGFLFKQTSAHELGAAIRAVHAGKHFFASTIPGRPPRQSSGRLAVPVKKSAGLTSRETEVAQLVAEGKANKQIGMELGIGLKTVEKHREHLMKKLGIHDTAGLTRYAIAAGIVESPVQVTTREDERVIAVARPRDASER